MEKKELRIFSFPLLTVILPFYSGYLNEWENICKNTSAQSNKVWKEYHQAFKNLLKFTKFEEIHTYRKELDETFLDYVREHPSLKFQFILQSPNSYKLFKEFLQEELEDKELIKSVYLVDCMMNENSRHLKKICRLLRSKGIRLEVLKTRIPKEIEFKEKTIYYGHSNYPNSELAIPYIEIVRRAEMIHLVKKFKCCVFEPRMIDALATTSILISAEVFCIKEREILKILDGDQDLSEMLKTSVKKFVLYNCQVNFDNEPGDKRSGYAVEPVREIEVDIEFAINNFAKLETIEISLFGVSASYLNQILGLETDKEIDIDLHENNQTQNSLTTDKNIVYLKTKEGGFEALEVDSIYTQFNEKEFLFSLKHNFVILTNPTHFKLRNIRKLNDFEEKILTEKEEAMVDLINLSEYKEIICGFTLDTLQYINLYHINQCSILPKLCVQATLRFIFNDELDLLTSMAYISSLSQFISLNLEFYHSSLPANEETHSLLDQEVKKKLMKLNVVSLNIKNAKSEEYLRLIMDSLAECRRSWNNLKNISTQCRFRTAKSHSCRLEDQTEIPDILIKNSFD